MIPRFGNRITSSVYASLHSYVPLFSHPDLLSLIPFALHLSEESPLHLQAYWCNQAFVLCLFTGSLIFLCSGVFSYQILYFDSVQSLICSFPPSWISTFEIWIPVLGGHCLNFLSPGTTFSNSLILLFRVIPGAATLACLFSMKTVGLLVWYFSCFSCHVAQVIFSSLLFHPSLELPLATSQLLQTVQRVSATLHCYCSSVTLYLLSSCSLKNIRQNHPGILWEKKKNSPFLYIILLFNREILLNILIHFKLFSIIRS